MTSSAVRTCIIYHYLTLLPAGLSQHEDTEPSPSN